MDCLLAFLASGRSYVILPAATFAASHECETAQRIVSTRETNNRSMVVCLPPHCFKPALADSYLDGWQSCSGLEHKPNPNDSGQRAARPRRTKLSLSIYVIVNLQISDRSTCDHITYHHMIQPCKLYIL